MRRLLLAITVAVMMSCFATQPGSALAFSRAGTPRQTVSLSIPELSIRVTPAQAKPGDVVIVRVTSDNEIRVLGWLDERVVRFARSTLITATNAVSGSQNGHTYIALIGLDALMPSGTYSLTIAAVGSDGRAARFTRTFVVLPQYGVTERIAITKALSYTLDPVLNQNEIDTFAQIYSDFSEQQMWSGPFTLPVQGKVAAAYGNRRIYNGVNLGTYHSGVDFVAGRGTPVKAAATGKVVLVGSYVAHGMTIVIDHGRGVFSAYGHLSKTKVITGELVRSGDIIGLVGNTGRSQGPHLHFEVSVGGVTIDPQYWFRVALPG